MKKNHEKNGLIFRILAGGKDRRSNFKLQSFYPFCLRFLFFENVSSLVTAFSSRWRKVVSPKTNSLAYDVIREEPYSIIDVDFAPELNLIIPKRSMNESEEALNRALSISGCLTVSF